MGIVTCLSELSRLSVIDINRWFRRWLNGCRKLGIRFILNRPMKCLIAVFGVCLLLSPGLFYIQSDFTNLVWFRSDDSDLVAYHESNAMFYGSDSLVIAVLGAQSIFNSTALTCVYDLHDELDKLSDIVRLDSLVNFPLVVHEEDELLVKKGFPFPPITHLDSQRLESQILSDDMTKGFLMTNDHRMTYLYAHFVSGMSQDDIVTYVTQVRGIIDQVQARYPDLQILLSGDIALDYEFQTIPRSDIRRLLPILLGITLLMLGLMFKHKVFVVIPMIVMGVTLNVVFSVMGWLGISLNPLLIALPIIIICIVCADTVHLMATYIKYRQKGYAHQQAMLRSYLINGVPVLSTTLTTMIGFGSLMGSSIQPISDFGFLAGLGMGAAWLSTMILVGPISHFSHIKNQTFEMEESSFSSRHFVEWIQRYRCWILIGVVGVLGVSLIGATFNQVRSNPLNYFTSISSWKMDTQTIQKNGGAMSSFTVAMHVPESMSLTSPSWMEKATDFELWLESQPTVLSVVSVYDVIKKMNEALFDSGHPSVPTSQEMASQLLFLYTMNLDPKQNIAHLISVDQRMVQYKVLWDVESSDHALASYEEIELRMEQLGLDGYVTGKIPLLQKIQPFIAETFFESFLITMGLMSLYLGWLFRSIKWGLMCLIPNIFPLVVGLGAMSVMGGDINIGSVIVFSSFLGIAVDDTIHFSTHFTKVYRRCDSVQIAVEQTIDHVGRPLVLTTFILVCGFVPFIFANFIPNQSMSLYAAIIMTSALVFDLVVIPALLIRSRSRQCNTVPVWY